MRRRLLNLLTALSLLTCFAAVAVWASGFEGSPSRVWDRVGPVVGTWPSVALGDRVLFLGIVTKSVPDEWSIARRWGFGYARNVPASRVLPSGRLLFLGAYHGVNVPLWFVAAAAAGLPLFRAVALVKRRRRNGRGLCPRCGYDLRATPGMCPECGLTPATGGAP